MASLRDAELARDEFADQLGRLGAHAIEVRGRTRKGKKTFVVVAVFEKRPTSVPKVLQIVKGGRPRNVELLTEIAPPGQPE